MIAPEYCQLMARYNRWMNERLYALLSEMPDEERKRERAAQPPTGGQRGRLRDPAFGKGVHRSEV